MPVDDALMIELEALAKAEGKDSFHMWVGSENYEMRVDSGARPAWIDRRILAIIRGEAATHECPRHRRRHHRRHRRRGHRRRPHPGQGLPGVPRSTSPSRAGSSTRAEDIWQATIEATREVLDKVDASELTALGITNQRETIVLWDRETLGSPRRAIVWQDRRTADICDRLRDEGHEDRVAELTGLRLDPYFSGTKLMWLAEHEPHTWALVESGRYAVGTVDSYLIARMTRGTWHVTDVSNACRTLLFDLEAGDWSDELCELFGVPRDALPELVPNWGEVAPDRAVGRSSACRCRSPGIAGDQQSALFGQTCFEEGESKCTYGTGSFILTNTGSSVVRSDAGLLSTAAWRSPDGEMTYALEGAIFVTGSAVQWLRDGLQIVGNAAETAAIAQTVDDTDGVVFVPALTGSAPPTGTRTPAA